ncbi:MAG: head-tail connector protein [Terrisporobacter othiniensis]|uniref:head-tail connector protein n=1 Tax=Terrisporobacter othiniensis TaxID=1577792 RepID=UPI001B4CDBA1|nr:head-tail connector protein [Terrisporobacter othiniensis]MBP3930647.1 DNA-packaging protein [Peptostreptococcaceae bacterium]MDY3373316.1 head-tail connector protein [Terrisporobacter othiniensis]
MLEKVKLSLRIKSNSLDLELSDLIEACKIDLSISGVRKVEETDPIINRAIILYCKANFGLDNKDSEKYQKSYDLLKQSLSLCGDYNVV